jgi:molybdopterin-guanine dinucleotide biosynthesis protein A
VSTPTVAELEAATAVTAAAIETGDLAGVYAAAEEALYAQVFTGPCDTPTPEPEIEI